MTFQFRNIVFRIENNKIYIESFGTYKGNPDCYMTEVSIAGENKISESGIKLCASTEGYRMKYVTHIIDNNTLTIYQESELVGATTVFEAYDDTNTIAVHTEIKNISNRDIVAEEVSSFVMGGISPGGFDNVDNMYITTFVQSAHTECQPLRQSFGDYGFFSDTAQSDAKKRISFANVGGWSTKERLPMAIIENTESKSYLMFQIESSNSWYFEISDNHRDMYLYTGSANLPNCGWCKKLSPDETYTSVTTAIAASDTLNGVVGEMTKYRRHICGLSECDSHLPSIFNEYMHLSWDSPTEDNTKIYAPVAAKTGVEYYVIDCGWHNEEPGNIIYPYVGHWKESKSRFPNGMKATLDFVKSLGMKPGLWIEPEIIGCQCKEMQEYYDDDCFYQRNGGRVTVFNRQFLDYRNPKVIEYMSETIRRMVEDYGAKYIKCDYNQDPGIGTDLDASSYGEGLEKCNMAFLSWVESMKEKFPDVIFEACASGGMRMDYKTLSVYSLVSTSDQIKYDKYPYIAANVLAAVLPEQAAVWSYPVGECNKEEITDRQIIVNMINSFLGRMHLASHLDYMTDEQIALVREGVQYYNMLTEIKKTALPYFPFGFTKFGEKKVACGLQNSSSIYLACWNLDNKGATISIPLDREIASATIGYPSAPNSKLSYSENTLNVKFDEGISASFIEINLK